VFNGAGWKPVIAVPGLTPKFPFKRDGPAFVTVVAPRTVNVDTEPKGTVTLDVFIRDLFRFCNPVGVFASRSLDGELFSHAVKRNATSRDDVMMPTRMARCARERVRTAVLFMNPPKYYYETSESF
jgi:hypothetical protein